MASSARQERRRKIVERGSDRLALITGQIQNLSESPSSTPTYHQRHHAHSESSPSIMFQPDDHFKLNAALESLDGASAAKLMKLRTINGMPEYKSFDSPRKPESRFRNLVTSPEKTIPQVIETKREIIQEPEPVITQPPKIPNNASNHHHKRFSSIRINACIISSEGRRAICSLIVALLVITSHTNYPLGMNIANSKAFISSRPLFIVIFSDVGIVIGYLLREIENIDSEENDGNKEDRDNWDGAVILLERGLVLYRAIRGLFIDCSIYLVVVICGLSLL